MRTDIPAGILSLNGQKINNINHDVEQQSIIIHCSRDRRRSAIDPITGVKGTVNQYIRRQVKDLPLLGMPCLIDMELAQVVTDNDQRRIEHCEFVDKHSRVTRRFAQMISGLCRHMSIDAVARHLNLSWQTVKDIDKKYLHETLRDLDPTILTDLEYIGVDEVARAKGHNYMTVVYDMVSGHLIGVETGRTADVLIDFLTKLPKQTAAGIKAVAMDMGLSYQKAVRECLPKADIVFDRFHVMQNFSKAMKNQRRKEFKNADQKGKDLMKGTNYLLLSNADKLSESQTEKLKKLLENNSNLNVLYTMKEQLQALWSYGSYDEMSAGIDVWCELAEESGLQYLKKFAKSLKYHRVGICNYATHGLTSARIEAGNVSIGMIRKRARGIRDTEYFKLKIRQSSLPDNQSMFYYSQKSTS